MRDGLPVFDPACTTVERLEAGRSRWWTFAGAKGNWLLGHAVRPPGSSMRIDDFYIEMKGTLPTATMQERLQTHEFSSSVKMSAKAIALKFREAVPENLLMSIVNSRTIDRAAAERVSTQPVSIQLVAKEAGTLE